MWTLDIPSHGVLELAHAVTDFNGTLACDGALLPGVAERVAQLAERMQVHVVTGDLHGTARQQLRNLPCAVSVLASFDQARQKCDYLLRLGARHTVAIGNGRNDRLMLGAAALGIAVLEAEGAAAPALLAATLVTRDIRAALDLLLFPRRLLASLRG